MTNDNPYAVSYNDTDPQVQVRTDLWPTMGMPELVSQRDILMTRMERVSRMMGAGAAPAVFDIYSAMQIALRDINQLIDTRTSQK